MPESPEPSDPTERRLPTKAQIRAAAYGDRKFAPAETPAPQNPPPAVITSAENMNSPDDDRWIVVAARADGWEIAQCEGVLQRHRIETETSSSGPAALRVRRRNFSDAVRLLQAEKQRLWKKPTGSANLIVGLAVAAIIVLLVIGGTIAAGRMQEFSGAHDVIAIGIVMPMVIMGILFLASMTRSR